MKQLLLIPLISLTLYLAWHFWRYGMSASISDTYKKLRGWKKVLFTLTLWSVAIPIAAVGIENVPDGQSQVLFFLAGALICLVGATPEYWANKRDLTAHMIGALGGIGFGMLACLVYFFSIQTLIIIGVYVVIALTQELKTKLAVKYHTYFVEVLALIIVTYLIYMNW